MPKGWTGSCSSPWEGPTRRSSSGSLRGASGSWSPTAAWRASPRWRQTTAGGSAALAEHLISLGYRRLAYIAGPKGVSTAEDRLAGFARALEAHGLTPVTVRRGDFTLRSGYALAREVLSQHREVDAIVAGNDLMAIGVLRAAEDMGVEIPETLGVAGFDHVLPADLVRPRLTTVAVPAYEMGREAMRRLLEGSDEGKVLPVKLIAGDSTPKRGGDGPGKEPKAVKSQGR